MRFIENKRNVGIGGRALGAMWATRGAQEQAPGCGRMIYGLSLTTWIFKLIIRG